jgi:hypothetical protein
MTPVGGSCANCAEPLTGDYCSHCGQQAIDLHRPRSDLFSDVVGDIFNLDTRLLRTLRPLMFTPGAPSACRPASVAILGVLYVLALVAVVPVIIGASLLQF